MVTYNRERNQQGRPKRASTTGGDISDEEMVNEWLRDAWSSNTGKAEKPSKGSLTNANQQVTREAEVKPSKPSNSSPRGGIIAGENTSKKKKKKKPNEPKKPANANEYLQKQLENEELYKAGKKEDPTNPTLYRVKERNQAKVGELSHLPKEEIQKLKDIALKEYGQARTQAADDQLAIDQFEQPFQTPIDAIDRYYADDKSPVEIEDIPGLYPEEKKPEHDPTDDVTVPKSVFADPTRQYLATAEPATQEDKDMLHSGAFQQTALVFGLDLLFGSGEVGSALQTAGMAYRTESFKGSEQYKKYKELGIPDEVINQALKDDDWTELRAWYKQGLETTGPKEFEPNALQKSLYESVMKQNNESMKTRTAYMKGQSNIDNFKVKLERGDKLLGTDLITLYNTFQSVVDPKGTVREGDVNLIAQQLGIMPKTVMYLRRFDPRTAGMTEVDPEVLQDILRSTETVVGNGMASEEAKVQGWNRMMANAGIPQMYWGHMHQQVDQGQYQQDLQMLSSF